MLVSDVPLASLETLLSAYTLTLCVLPVEQTITASYWGDSEAGIVGRTVYVRNDTPVHSLLHEACHIICMSSERRERLATDAGGDDLEEAAVCYLQVVLADEIDGVGRAQLMSDMDAWGYSFRLGNTAAWFDRDTDAERKWLIDNKLLTNGDVATFQLRG